MTWHNDLQTRFCQYTGIPLDRPHWKTTGATSTLGCHWNHTGWCLHPVVSQWRSSVNLHNWNTLEDHWKATGRPMEDHWKHTGISPVAFQCTLGSKFQAHWIATGRPLAQGKGCQTLYYICCVDGLNFRWHLHAQRWKSTCCVYIWGRHLLNLKIYLGRISIIVLWFDFFLQLFKLSTNCVDEETIENLFRMGCNKCKSHV